MFELIAYGISGDVNTNQKGLIFLSTEIILDLGKRQTVSQKNQMTFVNKTLNQIIDTVQISL